MVPLQAAPGRALTWIIVWLPGATGNFPNEIVGAPTIVVAVCPRPEVVVEPECGEFVPPVQLESPISTEQQVRATLLFLRTDSFTVLA
jgi:hypothetical protein